MVLRLPTSIADASLLEDEPFLGLFEARYATTNTRKTTRRVGGSPNGGADGLVSDVVKEMRVDEHGVRPHPSLFFALSRALECV